MAAILGQLELGLGGNGSATLCGIFLELLCFTDLTQEEQLSTGKDLQVDDEATVVVKAKINGEMYVVCTIFVTIDNDFVISGFEAG